MAANSLEFYEVTLVSDTSILADNDVISDMATISNAVPGEGGRAILRSVVILDEDFQSQEIDLVFSSASTALGTKNAAVSITDANARNIQGVVGFLTTDYVSLIGSSIATKMLNPGLVLKAASGSRDLYVGAIARSGTPTYTASGLKLRIGLQWMGS